jgi:hypothetical protein
MIINIIVIVVVIAYTLSAIFHVVRVIRLPVRATRF